MDCCKTDVVSLMQSGVRFHIPFYQRPYEWGEYQCQVLLDDLDLVRAQLPNPAPHFLGTLVVQPQENIRELLQIKTSTILVQLQPSSIYRNISKSAASSIIFQFVNNR